MRGSRRRPEIEEAQIDRRWRLSEYRAKLRPLAVPGRARADRAIPGAFDEICIEYGSRELAAFLVTLFAALLATLFVPALGMPASVSTLGDVVDRSGTIRRSATTIARGNRGFETEVITPAGQYQPST